MNVNSKFAVPSTAQRFMLPIHFSFPDPDHQCLYKKQSGGGAMYESLISTLCGLLSKLPWKLNGSTRAGLESDEVMVLKLTTKDNSGQR